MIHRWLILLTCIFLLSGCAGDGTTNQGGGSTASAAGGGAVAPTPAPTATPAPVTLSALNASAVATDGITAGSVQAIIPAAASGLKTAGARTVSYLPAIDGGVTNSTALGLALDVALTGGTFVQSPLGGSFTAVEKSRGALVAHFTSFKTLQGTLKGEVDVTVTSGSPASGTFQADVAFVGLSLETPDGTYAFNGPAALSVAGASGAWQVAWEASYTVSIGTSSVRYQKLQAINHTTVAGTAVTSRATLSGGMQLTRLHGVTGNLTVSTPVALTFSGVLSNNAAPLQVTAGALSFNGGQMTVSVVKPNAVTVAVGGTTVKTVPWAYLGGPLRAVFALRPTVADTVFESATVLTVDSVFSRAQAVAVLDGRVLAIGSNAAVSAFKGAATSVVPLTGKTLMPGFVEPHAHVNQSALTLMANVNPQVVACGSEALGNTLQGALDALHGALVQVPGAAALYGFNFDPSRLVPAELMQNLTLAQLDGISATVPIVVQNASQHISYANSAAFRATGIWPSAPNAPYAPPPPSSPLYGFIPVDPNTGLPTGQLNEFAQSPFILVALGGITQSEQAKAQYIAQWREFMNVLAKQGVTTVSDMLTGAALGLNGEAEVFSALALDPTNPVRIRAYIDSASYPDPAKIPFFPGEGYDRLRFNGAKFVADGSTQGLTAGLNFDYIFPGPFPVAANGLMDYASATIQYGLELPWYAAGWQLAVHSNGDKALEQTMSTFQMLQQASPQEDARFRIEHFTVHLGSELASHVATARQLQVNVGQTIGHVYFWGQVFSDTLLGADVSRNIDPMKSLFDAGVRVSTHSDSPVTTPNPLRNLYISTVRLWQALPQQVLGPQEIISITQAIRTVTSNPAYALRMDGDFGSIEVGKVADLVVLGQDPTAVAPDALTSVPVISTWLAGRRVSGTAP